MALKFTTNLPLASCGFTQKCGDYLILSGNTRIADTGTIAYLSDLSGTYTCRSLPDVEYVNKQFTGATGAITGATNVGGGVGVYSGVTNRTIQFYSFVGSGSTSVTLVGNQIRICSTPSTGATVYWGNVLGSISNQTDLNTCLNALKAYTGYSYNAITGATNGLTKAGRQVKLGGTLTGNTCINLTGHTLYITGYTVGYYGGITIDRAFTYIGDPLGYTGSGSFIGVSSDGGIDVRSKGSDNNINICNEATRGDICLRTTRSLSIRTSGLTLQYETAPPMGVCSDCVLVWNSTDCCVKILPYSSGGTANAITGATNVGSGVGIYSGKTNQSLYLKSLIGCGSVSISGGSNAIYICGTSTGCASGENVVKLINQPSHGFNVQDIVGWSGGTYNKAIADGTYDGEVVGIVSKCYNVDCFQLMQSGYITGLTGLVTNTTYFLSDVTTGLLTATEPTGDTHISKAVLIATSASSGWVFPYAGYVITTGDTGGGGTWGTITGTLSNQTDLWNTLVAISGQTYNLSSPSTCTVGGLVSGTILTGKTAFELLEEILVPTLYPTLTSPSTSTSSNPSGCFEVGCVISTLCIISTYNAGCINPQYTAACDKRSNGVDKYCFTGCQVVGCYSCTSTSMIRCATSYAICSGSQTWGTCSRYCCGVQPKDNKGDDYDSPLPSGWTTASNVSLTGIYPYYYGKLTGSTRPPVTQNLVTGGTKCVASSTGTVTVDFDSTTEEYTWLAIPYASTSKTCWFVTDLNMGKINSSPSDKYPDECQLYICSGQGCWTNVCFKVYMSGTVGAITDPIQFRNS